MALTNGSNGRRVREDFAKIPAVIDIPNLIDIQLASYERFLQWEVRPSERRQDEGEPGPPPDHGRRTSNESRTGREGKGSRLDTVAYYTRPATSAEGLEDAW